MTKSDDYLWDRSGDRDPEIAGLEDLLAPLRHDPARVPLDELRLRRKRRWLPIVLGAGVAVAAVLALVLLWPRGGEPTVAACAGNTGFKLTARGGAVACGGAAVETGELPIGTLLDTGTNQAELAYDDPVDTKIHARLTFGANTRVRLDHTSGDRHELFLQQGHMHAFVSAPPRIFATVTPSTKVTDLGCEYTLDIDAAGAGTIHVLTGKVELQGPSGEPVVLYQGMWAHMLPGRVAGVRLGEQASPELAREVHAFESGDAAAVPRVVALVKRGDAITLADLAVRAPAEHKRAVLETLMRLVPAPQETTVDEALADPVMLDMWLGEVLLVQIGASGTKTR
jgi:hypothetical protein